MNVVDLMKIQDKSISPAKYASVVDITLAEICPETSLDEIEEKARFYRSY